jgi:DNA-binding MarR family transcriptional regulator
MSQRISQKDQEILSIIQELTKAVRCCRQDGICCENISLTQFTILDAIAECRELDMSILSKVLSVDKSTTRRLVEPRI